MIQTVFHETEFLKMDFIPFINKVDFSEFADSKYDRDCTGGVILYNPIASTMIGQYEARLYRQDIAELLD